MEADDYTLKLSAVSGYNYLGDSYIAWAQQFEDAQNPINYTPLNEKELTLAYRIKILRGSA
jgi:hypothetical protein